MELSRELARRGQIVHHTYFADNKSTPKGSDSKGNELANLKIEGVHIQREFTKYGLLSRRAADIEYGQAIATRVKEFCPDVVISANMPLDGQRVLLSASKRSGARFVFWLQDVYSTAVHFVLGKKMPLLAGLGSWYYEQVEKNLMKKSDEIVCIAPAFVDHLTQWRIDRSKITMIPNWAPLEDITPMPKNNAWARENGLADKFCFMYSGTLGMKHRPELLLDLAKRIEGRSDVRLVVIAGGAGADWLAENAHTVSGDALKLLPFQPYERVPEAMAASDVLIALLDSEAGAFAVPSKTLAYLCAARPLILAAPKSNEAARVVESADAGIVISPDAPQKFIAAAEELLSDEQLRARFGANAREYAERTFAIDRVADQFLQVFHGKSASDVRIEAESVEA
jgi:glycosyltransferase involved in cell wall biosynthesis